MGKELECTSCDRASHVYITLGLHACARAQRSCTIILLFMATHGGPGCWAMAQLKHCLDRGTAQA